MRHFLATLAKTLLVFGVLGPFIGLIIFATTIGVLGFAFGPKDAHYMGPFLLLYGWIFAHYVGVIWALLAAVVAAILSYRFGRAGWIGVASGGVSLAVAALTGATSLPPESTLQSVDGAVKAAAVLTHLGAATVCWLMVRPWIALR